MFFLLLLRIKSRQIINWTKFGYNSHLKKINKTTYFENVTVRLYVFYVLINTHVKFCVNQILFTIRAFFFYIIVHYRDLKFKHMINNLTSYY